MNLMRTIAAAAVAVTLAQPAAAQQAQPSAAEVIKRYLTTTKLETVVSQRTSLRTRFKLEAPSVGITGTLELIRSKPNLFLQKQQIGPGAESLRGFDGKNGWTLNASTGPALLAGTELIETAEEAQFAFLMRDTSSLKVLEMVGPAEYGGQKCYKLRLVTKAGRESFECFAIDTGLLIATQRKAVTRAGPVDEQSLYSEYKPFNGVLFATKRVVQGNPAPPITLTLELVEFNTVQAAEFVPPPQVRALIK